jgi:hypothetical protein
MWESVVDLPVIVQGALGSFLFWLVYTLVAKLGARLSRVSGSFNKAWRKETLLFEQMQSQYMVSDPDQRSQYLLLCMYGAISRSAQGLIYACFGLVAYVLVGPVAVVAFGFSIVYFFRAMKAVHLEVSDGKTVDWHRSRISDINKELADLESRK